MKHSNEFDLGGRWRFRLDPDNLGEHFPEQLDLPWHFDARWMSSEHDDGEWSEIHVPDCWQVEGFNYNGAAWYRTRFEPPPVETASRRLWLRFEGVDYFADVWVNDHYLGSHEGYFTAFQYEVTPYLRPGPNLLAVRVDSPNDICAKESQRGQLKGLIKGALQRWDVNNPEVNPGGVWDQVKLVATGAGAIVQVRVSPSITRLPDHANLAEPVPAMVLIGVEVAGFPPSAQNRSARLRVRLRPVQHDGPGAEAVLPITVIAESCFWPIPIALEQARLWYTWDLGEPCLYQAHVRLEVDDEVSDEVGQTFGIRRLERRAGWETYLNGVRFFQRGANYLSDQLLSTMTMERYTQDLRLLREANLNTVHPFAVVEKQCFYDLCDRFGLLVYQDFPMWLTMDNSSDLVRRATLQVRELITQFGHHPSLGIWNFGSQPSQANFRKLCSALAATARELDPHRIVHQANALIEPGEAECDPVDDYKWSRRTAQAFQSQFDWRVDTHQYAGWYWGDLATLQSVPIEHLELVTEYGAQALPSKAMLEAMMPAQALFPPVWSNYTRRCFQPEYQFKFIGPPASLEQWIADSQAYQARFIQYHTEFYRRHKFAPCNGAHLFCFNDCWPAITWSVVDYQRNRKAGFYALQRAMSPLQAFADLARAPGGEEGAAAHVWLVNDYARPWEDLILRWSIKDELSGRLLDEGDMPCGIEANTVNHIGTLRWHLEPASRVSLALELRQGGALVAENAYQW